MCTNWGSGKIEILLAKLQAETKECLKALGEYTAAGRLFEAYQEAARIANLKHLDSTPVRLPPVFHLLRR